MANGFLSFDDYLNVNGGTEEEMLRKAMADAEAKDAAARTSLQGVEREGLRNGGGDITQVASYGDYLQLKRGAADAWAKLLQSSDPRQRAVLQTLGAKLGVGAAASSAAATRDAREEDVTGDLSGFADSRAQWARINAKKQAEADARTKGDTERARQFYASAYTKGPANEGGFMGGAGGNQDRQRWAQMVETGLGTGAFQLPEDYAETRRENLDRYAWGTPVNSAVGSGRGGVSQQRDAFGRVVDEKTGRPLYGYGETGD